MDNVGDFVQYLGPDMSIKILTHLDDPSDLVRVCAASSSWHRFVIENNISKHLCLRLVPEVLGLARFIEGNIMIKPLKDASNTSAEWERNKINHRVYAFLARGLSSTIEKSCLSEAICASSTDNYPEESMQNTLEPRDRVERRASYWSSKGQSDPEVPETLLYRLASKLCVVTEIHVQPFQAYFQFGFPIYSAKAVRFRMGHPKSPMEMDSEAFDKSQTGSESADGNFVWTYTSPEFPMVQENCLQKLKLPEPVLCIGGILQVELVSHVKVLGRPLLSPFDVEIDDASGKCALKYRPIAEGPESSLSSAKDEDGGPHSRLRTLSAMLMLRGVRSWEQIILSRIRGAGASVDSNESEDELPA
ncbi:hypothetical protein CRG98_043825 [Punica granatum]|uniref:F-box domain-containing protein n=1 Tax=Punica granatum TaxID=22663 RepID=A0A2I0HWA2_PUNGR|nr:hypothetical protein CRG98_043825 [Punica granatum]